MNRWIIYLFAPLVICLLGLPGRAVAQDPDVLVQLLDSPDWEERHGALFALNKLPVADLPPSFAPKIIALPEKEAVSPDPEAFERGEGYGEYVIAVVRAVQRLNDPRSLRGMAPPGHPDQSCGTGVCGVPRGC